MSRVATAALALLATSCVAVEGFDPVGDVAAVRGRWQIDSADPTSTSCEALGADRVHVSFLDGLRPVAHSGLFFRCDEGEFTTVGSGGAVIGAGRWTVRLDAINSSGTLIAVGACEEIEVAAASCGVADTPVVRVPNANFLSGIISAGFRIGGQDPNQERCDAAGISAVSLVFEDLGGGSLTAVGSCGTAAVECADSGVADAGAPTTSGDPQEPCAAGFIGVRVAPGHTYRVRVSALDEAGAVLRESDAQDVTIAAGSDVELDASGTIELGP